MKAAFISLSLFCFTLTTLGALRLHWRILTILIGYEIGHLKEEEDFLLEEQNVLRSDLSRFTTRKSLENMASSHQVTETNQFVGN